MNGSQVIEQPALFSSEDEETGALFLNDEETVKRYTGQQAEKLRWKRNLILLAVGSGVPVSVVAKEAEVSVRTVEQLVCAHAEKVASHLKGFGRQLLGKSARWGALAQMREGSAKFSELVIGMGIAAQRGSELLASSGMGEGEGENVLQMEAEPAGVMERVRELLAAPGERPLEVDAATGAVHATLVRAPAQAVEGQGTGEFAAVGAAAETNPAHAAQDLEPHVIGTNEASKSERSVGAGGGSVARVPGNEPMCQALHGILAKGSLNPSV